MISFREIPSRVEDELLPYFAAETGFLRSFGNRSLLLLLLCVLTRTGPTSGDTSEKSIAKISALGLAIDINPAVVTAFGPILALLLLISLKVEADSLLIARYAVLDEAGKLKRPITVSRWVYALFAVPAASAAYMSLQFALKLFPSMEGCQGWSWIKQLTDFSHQDGTSSIYCLGDLVNGTPWIYPPLQTYLYLVCVATCIYLTYLIAKDWKKSRGGSAAPPGSGAR